MMGLGYLMDNRNNLNDKAETAELEVVGTLCPDDLVKTLKEFLQLVTGWEMSPMSGESHGRAMNSATPPELQGLASLCCFGSCSWRLV